jgi:signal transduction histidine kinase
MRLPRLVGRLPAPTPTPVDVTIAVAFAVVAELELRLSSQNVFEGTVPTGVDSVLVLLPLVNLAWRRSLPFASCLTMAASFSVVGAGLHGTICFFGGFFPFLVLLYSASAWARTPYDRLVLLVPVLLVAPMPLYVPTFFVPSDFIFSLSVSLGVWIAGQGTRRWQHQSHELADALAAVERGRVARERLAVAEERTRIARELHDVVAHGMSAMVMQAGVARLDVRDQPDRVEKALSTIEDIGRSAMLEMRKLLGILRSDNPDELEPQPRLAELPALVEGLTLGGLSITQQEEGVPRPLPAAQDLSAYRIVQEALTNALRHGADGSASIRLGWRSDRLDITVSNPVDPAAASGEGHGLIGIRERVALFGGTCRVGVVDRRHVTSVTLPYDGDHR